MTTFEFRNDADLDADDHARYCGLVEAAASLVADLSGLALPKRITAAAVTPAQFIQRQIEHSVLLNRLALNTVSAVPAEAATAMIDHVRTNVETMVSRFYPTNRAAIMWRDSEHAELTFMPEVYDQHLHPSERQLVTVFAHEVTHLAQFAVRPELAFAPLRCKLLDAIVGLPHEQHRNAAALIEGHGQYVERLVAERLCGEPVIGAIHGEPEPSGLYQELKADPAAPTNQPGYNTGERFIAAVIEAGGHPLLQQVLADEDLVPTDADLDDAALWLTRHRSVVESAVSAPLTAPVRSHP
ncbi:hypothetical protein [Streptomyces sp. CBMA123]|uniref:hypothetical protein n=1 Tax=Streptomyces sp. CBMA123 TaxID=1896313 RepID=UPI001661CC04|nr:hypothetical protein [Streptomyces sp. CBMA123]MBD0692470.1 hypothetical protein [Streptomyces sp. CBMA123]